MVSNNSHSVPFVEEFAECIADFNEHGKLAPLLTMPSEPGMPYDHRTLAHACAAGVEAAMGWRNSDNALDTWKLSDSHRESAILVSQSSECEDSVYNCCALTLAPLHATFADWHEKALARIPKSVLNKASEFPYDDDGSDIGGYAAFLSGCPGIATVQLRARPHNDTLILLINAFIADFTYIGLEATVSTTKQQLVTLSQSNAYPAQAVCHFYPWITQLASRYHIKPLLRTMDALL